jgi:hypothetical protein
MYGKLFASMYDGTLYGQWQAIVTLQQLVILADKDGVVDMTPPAIAARTSIPREIIEEGLEQLSGADKYSRSEEEDGRRIVLIDPDRPWGWRIVNYAKYRDMRSAEDRKAYMREYMQNKRKQSCKQQKLTEVNSKQPLTMLANTDTDTDTDTKNTHTPKRTKSLAHPECVSEQAWQDLLTHRKNLKAPLTATAWNAIAKEIDKAGLTPDAGIAEMLARGWRGFKAEWLEGKNEKPGRNYEQPEDRRRRELADYIARAEGGAGVAETGGNARSAVLEGIWERAE